MPIDAVEFFAILLHRDEESFRVEDAIKQQTWNSLNREVSKKETEKNKTIAEKTVVNKKFTKEGKNKMKQTKKILALCLCSTVVTSNIGTIDIEAKTFKEIGAASVVVSDTISNELSKVQTQTIHAFATSADSFTYDTNGATTITITGYEGTDSDVVIPETIDGYTVTKIGESVFKNNKTLNSISLPDTITSIEKNAFAKCINLKTIDIPDSVTIIGEKSFYECTGLTTVKLSSNLTTLGHLVFGNCTALTSIVIPKSVEKYDSSTYGPFYGCTHLYTAMIEEGATTICERLFFKSGVETIYIPNSVESVEENAFHGCANLKTIDIPDSVTIIGEKSFYECTGLTSVKLSSNLTTLGHLVFGNCTALASIVIPKSVEKYDSSTYGPFYGCTHLYTATIEEGATQVCERLFYKSAIEAVNIPSTITSVEKNAFYDCTNLKNIYFSCNAPTIAAKAFDSVKATAYYPENNSTWTSNVKQNYGGTLTWVTWTPAVTPEPVATPTVTPKVTTTPVATATIVPTQEATAPPVAAATVVPTQEATTAPKATPTATPITKTTVSKVTTSTSKKKVFFRWKKKSGVSGYQIYRKTGNGKYKLVKTIKKATTTKWTDKSVKSGKTYCYKIRAYKIVNKKKTYSKFSAVKKVKVK